MRPTTTKLKAFDYPSTADSCLAGSASSPPVVTAVPKKRGHTHHHPGSIALLDKVRQPWTHPPDELLRKYHFCGDWTHPPDELLRKYHFCGVFNLQYCVGTGQYSQK